MKTFYGSFTFGHTFEGNSILIKAKSQAHARYAMLHTFGKQFSNIHNESYNTSNIYEKPVMELIVKRKDDENLVVTCKKLINNNL